MNKMFVENTPEGRPPRGWDFFLTIFLLLMLIIMTGVFVIVGFGLGVTTIACNDPGAACNSLVISIGTLTVMLGTPLVALAGVVVSVVWIARRKHSFLIALIALLAAVGLFALGTWLVDLAVP
ncbi:MAG: hypothetical protein Q8M65_02300 [Rhodoglobus sp.]|nr:hypothetical protein [Rhodoglobus sp.]